ncbi:hypothetical protein S40293_03316 [Stachybotrys chartarum IBT 40293]|nr:hypothetical protein S40293_03316 [Stachybotrys chartarum IBT 40293]
MAFPRVRHTTIRVLLGLACAANVCSADATSWADDDVPEWATENPMHLALSLGGVDLLAQEYTMIPLTQNIGANESAASRGIVHINGYMISAEPSTYHMINSSQDIAYLSCDTSASDASIDHNQMFNDLMSYEPLAIVLYSTSRNWCAIGDDTTLEYTSIFSMADAAESIQVLSYLNETNDGEIVRATISGSRDADEPTITHPPRTGSSTAMSILYAVTGLVAAMFLIVIISGAIRAHRYPERYGPRGAGGGRPRQSRAKGLARAVLDTIPIVKFGSQQPPKPDPELEMDAATTDAEHTTTNDRSLNNASNAQELPDSHDAHTATRSSMTPSSRPTQDVDGEANGGHLGCTICTEDFRVGEDVRVLPCSHQFHPNCIDPWLINVSGTCPLCRMDLRPGRGGSRDDAHTGTESGLPPPLVFDDGEGSLTHNRHRFSRFFDVNRLRQAPYEEQMAALRQMRSVHTEQNEGVSRTSTTETDGESRRQGARLAAKLKDKFRIRTRAQTPH